MMRHRGEPVTLRHVSGQPISGQAQLLLYRFPAGADYEGRLTGALERMESGGALRVLEALFVGIDAATDELLAASLRGGGAGGLVAPLLSFRLDPAERRKATARALDADASGIRPETMRELARSLEPGAALIAVLVEHVWTHALDEAVARGGGTPLTNQFVEATTLADAAPALLAAVAA